MAQMQEIGVLNQNIELTANDNNPVIQEMHTKMFELRRSHIETTITKHHGFTKVELDIFHSLVIAAVGLYVSWICQQTAYRTSEYAKTEVFKLKAEKKMWAIAKDHVTLCRQLHDNI